MANSTVCQSKWKPIVEPRRAKPKTYRQAPTHWLKFYEEGVIESEARTAIVQLKFVQMIIYDDLWPSYGKVTEELLLALLYWSN